MVAGWIACLLGVLVVPLLVDVLRFLQSRRVHDLVAAFLAVLEDGPMDLGMTLTVIGRLDGQPESESTPSTPPNRTPVPPKPNDKASNEDVAVSPHQIRMT